MTPAQLRALIPVDWRAALDGNLPETELEQLAQALSDERGSFSRRVSSGSGRSTRHPFPRCGP